MQVKYKGRIHSILENNDGSFSSLDPHCKHKHKLASTSEHLKKIIDCEECTKRIGSLLIGGKGNRNSPPMRRMSKIEGIPEGKQEIEEEENMDLHTQLDVLFSKIVFPEVKRWRTDFYDPKTKEETNEYYNAISVLVSRNREELSGHLLRLVLTNFNILFERKVEGNLRICNYPFDTLDFSDFSPFKKTTTEIHFDFWMLMYTTARSSTGNVYSMISEFDTYAEILQGSVVRISQTETNNRMSLVFDHAHLEEYTTFLYDPVIRSVNTPITMFGHQDLDYASIRLLFRRKSSKEMRNYLLFLDGFNDAWFSSVVSEYEYGKRWLEKTFISSYSLLFKLYPNLLFLQMSPVQVEHKVEEEVDEIPEGGVDPVRVQKIVTKRVTVAHASSLLKYIVDSFIFCAFSVLYAKQWDGKPATRETIRSLTTHKIYKDLINKTSLADYNYFVMYHKPVVGFLKDLTELLYTIADILKLKKNDKHNVYLPPARWPITKNHSALNVFFKRTSSIFIGKYPDLETVKPIRGETEAENNMFSHNAFLYFSVHFGSELASLIVILFLYDTDPRVFFPVLLPEISYFYEGRKK